MRVQSFVFTWPGHDRNAARLAASLSEVSTVSVVNSDPAVAADHPDWIHLDADAYFSAQWNAALERFDADLLFHIQADAVPADPPALVTRAAQVLSRPDVGVYEPDVDFTFVSYDRGRLCEVEPDLCQIPLTDCTCWALRGDVVRRFQPVDVDVNKYGWGIAPVAAALCRMAGAHCVRDFRFLVRHPRSRGYPSDLASRDAARYVNQLPEALRAEVIRCYQERELLRLDRTEPRPA